MSENGEIYSLIPKIMGEIKSIGKMQTNQMQRYKFRGVDDVYNVLNSILSANGVFTVPKILSERVEKRENPKKGTILYFRLLEIEYTFFAKDGSFITATVIGEAMDSGDKAANKAMSVAHKYAMIQVFCIPTEEKKDPEDDSHEGGEISFRDTLKKLLENYKAIGKDTAYIEKFTSKKLIELNKNDIDSLRVHFVKLKNAS